MFGKHTFLIIGLLVAGGVPYLSSRSEAPSRARPWQPAAMLGGGPAEAVYHLASAEKADDTRPPKTSKNPFGGTTSDSTSTTSQRPMESSAARETTSSPQGLRSEPGIDKRGNTRTVSTTASSGKTKLPPVDGSVPIRFEEVFRLDVNSAWLMARWPRVTTGLADLNLHGYRVPLVTGIREDDIAGALTYYYDPEQVIQKMTFRGVTGDPRRLVLFCTSQHGFERVHVPDPAVQVYRAAGTGAFTSELCIRPAAVIRADAPRERFEVALVLAR